MIQQFILEVFILQVNRSTMISDSTNNSIPVVSAVEKSIIKLSSHPGPHWTHMAHPGMSHHSAVMIALCRAKSLIK